MHITNIKGIGEKTAELLKKIEIETVKDALLYYPRSYIQFPPVKTVSEAIEGEVAAVLGKVVAAPIVKKVRSMQLTVTTIGDMSAKMNLVWFRMPYMKNSLVLGESYVFYGKVQHKNGRLCMEQPVMYSYEQYEALEEQFLPVYTVPKGLSNNQMQKMMRLALEQEILFTEYLPADLRPKYQLCEYNYAIKQIHFPDNMDAVITARKRLVFDELFLFVLNLQYQKERKEKAENEFLFENDDFIENLTHKLPYQLTNAQLRVLQEIKQDMRSSFAMQRLVQGDVGSGKTVLAFLAMADCAHNGYQSAIMAPTEVLAKQHYESFQNMCQIFGLDIPLILLTGSMTAKQKKEAYAKLQEHETAMVIGTHALIQEKVVYSNLALVITDEQHRFGVRQRESFAQKGKMPHVLVMSATPIPRTLAIILYGDLDISVVDEVPARRLPIKNCVVNTKYRPKAYEFIIKEVKKGHQAYVICPLVEESENAEGENVTDYAKMLQKELTDDIKVGLLHGQMKPKQKNEVMEQFAKNEIQVLVSTTVVEVGVNVPNATVMMIENADRFGLAQLHQLRGRVGRGDAQSYCIMINTTDTEKSRKRLDILNRSNDGFEIANEDLKLRGPGDFFGIRQSGEMQFTLADVYQDAMILQQVAGEVTRILEEDPQLELSKNVSLRQYLTEYLKEKGFVLQL
ncbi:MAG: ATP-dependent DNA helicase RecG [Lachnospiraceae bacterium]|nr:ATP-dependent DNA helicase RecG [Lachnospiraceae bacterium]